MSPDNRKFTPLTKEVRPLPPVEQAAKLLFSLFGDVEHDQKPPEITQYLIRKFGLFEGGRPYYMFQRYPGTEPVTIGWERFLYLDRGAANSSWPTPESPAVKPINVNDAKNLIVCTYIHHSLGYGPQLELGFSDKNEAFIWPKMNLPQNTPFKKLTDLEPARTLLEEKPEGRYSNGVLLSLWNRRALDYLQMAALSIHGASLFKLLDVVQKRQV